MVQFLQARAVNDLFGDPTLFLDFRFSRRALLFDLGDVAALSARELLRVSHVFVSHAHIDHFSGFDRLLRLCLHRVAPLHLVGPRDFIDRVEAKIGAYTWNLLDKQSVDFALTVAEVFDERIGRRSVFRARQAFHRVDEPLGHAPASNVLLDEHDFSVRAVVLDHQTECLAFAFEEKVRVNVVKEKLASLGLSPGAWLNDAKRAVRCDLNPLTPILVGGGRTIALGVLRDGCLVEVPGQKIAYIVDAADHDANRARIVTLARNADQLFIEAAFANEDHVLARQRHHLTAGAAGRMAREAQVKSVTALHASARYAGRSDHLVAQLEGAFQAAVER